MSEIIPIRVLVICPYDHIGGGQIHTRNLFSSRLHFTTRILCPAGDAFELFASSNIGEICKAQFLKKYFRKDSGWDALTIIRIVLSATVSFFEICWNIHTFKPDVVYANGIFDALFCIAPSLVFHRSLVITQQLIYRNSVDFKAMWLVALIANKQIAISEAVLENMLCVLRSSSLKSKCSKIFNAANIPDYIIKSSQDIVLIKFGIIAGILRWKGIKEYIEAIGLLRSNFPGDFKNAKFFIIGEPTKTNQDSSAYYDELQELSNKLRLNDTVCFLGKISNIETIYSKIDCCINFSLDPEPFGLTVVEAMARGKIVIVAAHGGPAEIVTHEYDGFHVKPKSVDELAKTMARIIKGFHSNEFQQIRNNSRQTAITKFSLDAQQQNYYHLFKSSLKAKRHTSHS